MDVKDKFIIYSGIFLAGCFLIHVVSMAFNGTSLNTGGIIGAGLICLWGATHDER